MKESKTTRLYSKEIRTSDSQSTSGCSSSTSSSASTTPPDGTYSLMSNLDLNHSGTDCEFQLLVIDDDMIQTVICSLGLIPCSESYHTVKSLLETLRHQCGNSEFEPISAEKARSALKALLSANENEVMINMAAAEGAPSRNL